MSDTLSNLQTAREFYGFAVAKNWDQALLLVTEDFSVVEAADLPFGGVLQGKQAVQKIFEVIRKNIDILGVESVGMTAGGDYVVSLMNMRARAEDGSELQLAFAEVMRFADGLIYQLKPFYFDHEMVRRAVAAKAQSS